MNASQRAILEQMAFESVQSLDASFEATVRALIGAGVTGERLQAEVKDKFNAFGIMAILYSYAISYIIHNPKG